MINTPTHFKFSIHLESTTLVLESAHIVALFVVAPVSAIICTTTLTVGADVIHSLMTFAIVVAIIIATIILTATLIRIVHSGTLIICCC